MLYHFTAVLCQSVAKRFKLSQIGLTIVATAIVSQPVLAINLSTLYGMAVAHDPVIYEARAKKAASDTLRSQSRSSLLPYIAAVASTNTINSESTLSSRQTVRNHKLELSLSQTLFNLQSWYAFRESEDLVRVGESVLLAAEQNLIIRLATAYINVLKANSQLSTANAQVTALKQSLVQAKQRVGVGLASATELSETQARYDNALATQIAAEATLRNRYDSLYAITGQFSGKLDALPASVELSAPTPDNVNAWIGVALSNNPSLKAAKWSKQAAIDDYKVKKGAHWPSLTFAAGQSSQRDGSLFNPGKTTADGWNTSVALNISLYTGGNLLAQTKQAYYEQQRAKAEFAISKSDVRLATRTNWRAVHTQLSRVKALKQALASSQMALKASRAAYEVGSRNSVDVLNSLSALYASEQAFNDARHDAVLSQLLLKQSAGTLTHTDLAEIDSLLVSQPSEHETPS